MSILPLAFVALLGAPDAPEREEPAVELRSLRGYLGYYAAARDSSSAARAVDVLADLRSRLDGFLDRSDITPLARSEALAIYHDLALEVGAAAAKSTPSAAPVQQDVYGEVIRRMQAAGQDTLALELEMLASPGIGMEPREIYESLARLMPGLRERAAPLPLEERTTLRALLRRVLAQSGWPDLEEGTALTSTIDLLLHTAGAERVSEAPVVARKLAEWTSRLLRAETARDGELAQEPAIIHLYRALESAAPTLSATDRQAAIAGLEPLEAPALAEGTSNQEGSMRSVEIGEVRLPLGAGQRIPPLSPHCVPDGASRHYLVPRKSYQVELIATPILGGSKSTYWVLARPGEEARLILPRCIPPGMVPITSAETGRIAFLADRRPWSMRRFLLAFQRAGGAQASGSLALRIYRHSALREIPLGAGVQPEFSTLVALLANPALRDILEATFWVDSREEAGRAAAFEMAGGILNGNTGLRDTPLSLPTVAEANRLLRDGERFNLTEPQFGMFNAIRLIPEPAEDRERSRYVIRTVLRIPN
jgi:hypothetical protein